jgi:ketosteroid isomerase-like protein
MKYLTPVILVLVIACSSTPEQKMADELMETDRQFSHMSLEQGMVKAFIHYADEQVVKLRDNDFPTWNRTELIASFSQINDSNLFLTWEPLKAEVAQSNDFGYTMGNWTLTTKQDTTYGNYVSIWRKDTNATWKYVLDTGTKTPGLFIPPSSKGSHL